ncbi:MAG TPA: DUF488 domain-containing protein [bacterium]|jgi:uncharacterized protein (DUF488 family)|nr:DUF488 domain-containing protein [bacterium]
MEIFTIGFAQKSARQFFGILNSNGIQRLIDIRVNNVSQLAGFTKKEDLSFFLEKLGGIQYVHMPQLAPTQDLLKRYQNKKIDWAGYEKEFQAILDARKSVADFDYGLLEQPTVMLCSEATAEHCHRRLVAERLKEQRPNLKIVHL